MNWYSGHYSPYNHLFTTLPTGEYLSLCGSKSKPVLANGFPVRRTDKRDCTKCQEKLTASHSPANRHSAVRADIMLLNLATFPDCHKTQ